MAEGHAFQLDIVIVGAGLAGLAASIACSLAGHRVTVLEGAKELAEVGAGLQITPNASRLFDRWGILDQVLEVGAEPTEFTVHRYADGKVLAREENFDLNIRRKYGERAPLVDVHRVDLQRILFEKAKGLGVDVRLHERVNQIDHARERPVVLTDGGARYECDLLVGADGLWSKCRDALLGHKDNPNPTGDLAFRMVLTLEQLQGDTRLKDWVANPQCHIWAGPDAHAVAYSIRRGEMFNLVLLCADDLPPDVARQPGSVDEMRALFKDWDPVLTRFLDYVDQVDKWKLMHRTGLDTWTNPNGTFLLIGDSCHPMLPYLAQGANSAIEDGAVLGALLAHVKQRSHLQPAVSIVERLRKERGEAIARETFQQRKQVHMPDGPDQEERDRIFTSQLGKEIQGKFPSRWTCPEVQPWLYGYDAYQVAEAAAQSRIW